MNEILRIRAGIFMASGFTRSNLDLANARFAIKILTTVVVILYSKQLLLQNEKSLAKSFLDAKQ